MVRSMKYIINKDSSNRTIVKDSTGKTIYSGYDSSQEIIKLFGILKNGDIVDFSNKEYELKTSTRYDYGGSFKDKTNIILNNGTFYNNHAIYHCLAIDGCKDIYLNNINIRDSGNNWSTTNYQWIPILIVYGENINIYNSKITDSGTSSIHIRNSNNINIDSCYINNEKSTYRVGEGCDIFYTNNVRINNCEYRKLGSGIGLFAVDRANIYNCKVYDSRCIGGYKVQDLTDITSQNIDFNNCLSDGNNNDINGFDVTTDKVRCKNINFTKCTSVNNKRYGYSIKSADMVNIKCPIFQNNVLGNIYTEDVIDYRLTTCSNNSGIIMAIGLVILYVLLK